MFSYKKIIILSILASTLPFLFLFSEIDFSSPRPITMQFISIAGSITGFIGITLLFWQLILGARHFSRFISADNIWLNRLHRQMGKYGVAFIFSHPFIQMFLYNQNLAWVFMPDYSTKFSTYVSYGRAAFFIILVIWVASAILKSKIKYRPWLYLHYLAYLAVFLSLLHAPQIGTRLNTYPALKNWWNFMGGLFLFIFIYRLMVFAGFGKSQYRLVKKEFANDDITIYEFTPLSKKLIPKIGQHIFIQLRTFGESHPFTVMEFNDIDNNITLGVKTIGRFTKKMKNLRIGAKVFFEGPFGVFTREAQNDQPKVIIAGGIGVTPFVDLIKKHSDKNTIFIYANRKYSDIIKREIFLSALGDNYYDFLSSDKRVGQSIINSRLDVANIQKIVNDKNINNPNYFVCGSPGFVKGFVKKLKLVKIPKNKIFFEELGN